MNVSAERKASPLLILGIVLLPFVFAWLTLKKGYSALARGMAFGWLAFSVILVSISPPPPNTSGTATSATTATSSASSTPAYQPALNLSDPSVLRSLMVGNMWACGDGEGRTYYIFRDSRAGSTFTAMQTARSNDIFQMSAVVDGDMIEKGKVQIENGDVVLTVNFMGQKNDFARGDGVTEYQGPFMVLSKSPDAVETWHPVSYSTGILSFTTKTRAHLGDKEAQEILDKDIKDVRCSISDDPTFKPAAAPISSQGGNDWQYTSNENGVVMTSQGRGVTIYLGRSCNAVSPQYGDGKWEWSNGGWMVTVGDKQFGFPRHNPPIAPPADIPNKCASN